MIPIAKISRSDKLYPVNLSWAVPANLYFSHHVTGKDIGIEQLRQGEGCPSAGSRLRD